MFEVNLPSPGRPHVLLETSRAEDILTVDPARIVALYKAHGAVLLRGFQVDVDRFGQFARQFCPTSVINESPGRRPLDPIRNVYTVDGGSGAFSFHPELSRQPWKPDAALFACLSPPSADGATTICDGIALVRALPETVRQGLEGRRLLYIEPTWPSLLEFWLGTSSPSDAQLLAPPANCPYFFRKLNGEVVRIFTRPALHRPMFSEELAFGNFLLFARFNNGRTDFPLLDDGRPVPEAWLQVIRETANQVGAAIEWRQGDLLMLDNTRFMHGRTAIRDASERIIATFFGYVGFANPDPEEPQQPLWRQRDFSPPMPPDWRR